MNLAATSVELLIGGIAIGSVYGLVALAHSLIWSGVRVVNFAQGEVFMAGAFMALAALTGSPALASQQPFVLAVVVGMAAAAVLGILIYVGAIAPTTRKGFLYVIAGCVGASVLLQNVAILVWGSSGTPFPAFFTAAPFHVGPFLLAPQDLWVTGISLVTMIALYLFLSRTRIGTAMRAAAQNRSVAGLMGVSHRLTDTLTIAVASALVGLAAVLLAPRFFVTPQMGSIVSSKAFTAAVLGGFGNIPGAVVGGLLLGVLENLSAGFVSSAYKDATAFVVMIVILMVKPGGILDAGTGRRA
jgi:branched-chain amino acid transport system permease protein